MNNKVSALWSLAYLGGEDVQAAFIHTLEKDYRGTVLQVKEWLALGMMLEGLGYMSSTSDSAFNYLLGRTSPSTWSKIRTWKPTEQKEGSDSRFASFAIQALGYSGRKEADRAIRLLADGDNPELHDLWGAILDAEFSLAQFREKGRDALFLTTDDMRPYIAWKQSHGGQEWEKFAQKWRPKN